MNYHLDLHQSLITVIQQVTRLSGVDTDHTQEELPGEAQSHRRLIRVDDRIDAVFDGGLEDVGFGELALEVGGEPDAGEGACFGEEGLGVEHGVLKSNS